MTGRCPEVVAEPDTRCMEVSLFSLRFFARWCDLYEQDNPTRTYPAGGTEKEPASPPSFRGAESLVMKYLRNPLVQFDHLYFPCTRIDGNDSGYVCVRTISISISFGDFRSS